jgi:allophanate hydrolase
MTVSVQDVIGWSLEAHRAARQGGITVSAVVEATLDALDALDDPAVVIGGVLGESARAQASALDAAGLSGPLHGVPFVVKDNIDVAGATTTAGCPSYGYTAAADATVVKRLRAAGAIPVAKVNLDQFATGLVGTRSPYGTPRNPIDPALVPGGSSSGSAVAVALGLVPFALGTDTAGSGRVPAAFCGVVGFKPTIGRLPTTGVVPAVRRIDCVSVFARTVAEARAVVDAASGLHRADPWSRPVETGRGAVRTIGVPARAAGLGLDPGAAEAFAAAVTAAEQAGFAVREFDLAPFLDAGRLLYGGPIVAERWASVGTFLASDPPGADPTVARIIGGGMRPSAVDAYRAEYRLAHLRAATGQVWSEIDALLLPTTPGPVTVAEVAADPVGVNERLGTFTTFVNLLDLAALAVPNPGIGAPYGVQLIGPAWSDDALADAAAALVGEAPEAPRVRPGEVALAVVGAHLTGMPLNQQLTGRGARLLGVRRTAPRYRLYALDGTVPPKPGLARVTDGGAAIEVEVWALGEQAFGSFVAEVPPPLGIGSLELDDGAWCKGFVCEPWALAAAQDITSFGGWRAYRAAVAGGAR